MKAIADENRVRVLMLLLRRELSVCELMAILRISQPLVSRHLSILKEAGLVRNRRDGKLHFYSVTDDALSGGKVGFIRLLSDALKDDKTAGHDRLRLRKYIEYQKKSKDRSVESLLRFSRQEVAS
ncbi:metalloregulator ArsR/SmtB family transcription factor [bacterium]|nr:metalloregulator ArsR/SmtB family transcription factor [bacterium]